MKILLDEMMPERFGSLLVEHEVSHAVDLGWRHVSNGRLLDLGEASGFEVFITKDASLPYQQNLAGRRIAILVLKPKTQDFLDLITLTSEVLGILTKLKPGSITTVASTS